MWLVQALLLLELQLQQLAQYHRPGQCLLQRFRKPDPPGLPGVLVLVCPDSLVGPVAGLRLVSAGASTPAGGTVSLSILVSLVSPGSLG